MSSICKLLTIGLIVLGTVALSPSAADAQWTGYYQPYQTYYAPSATAYSSYYAPTAHQTYYAPSAAAYQTYYAPAAAPVAAAPVVYTSGWYPGYWLDRTRAALFGRRPVVAAAPTTYAASYPSSYVASYPTNYTASYPTNYVASYPSVAAPACSSCVAPQQVTLRPACAPACATCEPCTNCAVTNVTPASYVETSPACTNCTASPATSEPTPAVMQGPSTYSTPQPGLSPTDTTPSTRQQLRPTTPVDTQGVGGDSTNGTSARSTDVLDQFLNQPENKENQESAKVLDIPDAPALFDPKDKTVKLSPAPIHMAVYKRPAGETRNSVKTQPISLEKAKRDAMGWTSASK